MSDPTTAGERPLVLVRGDATEEEVAALVAVVAALAAAASGGTGEPAPRSLWADPARAVRRSASSPVVPAGGAARGAWRASALPG